MDKNTLLFVPDITGFTEFVNKTEIEHSQHIISELLEKIIDNNKLQMDISEVEGDAVVFYKEHNIPGLLEIYDQVKIMFLHFHAHLKLYEKQRICQCGACSAASKLSLKFIVHAANIGFTQIKNQKKPFGTDIILLHRLLKNNIPEREYILFTDAFLQQVNSIESLYSRLKACEIYYENFGKVQYRYLNLSNLHIEVKDPPPIKLPDKMKNPVIHEQTFDNPIMMAFEYLSDFELKKYWNKDVKEYKYDKRKINRIGTQHVCVFDKGSAKIESVTNDFGEGNLVYGEKFLNFPLAKDLTIYFILSPVKNQTRIRIETHYKLLPVIGWIIKPFINMNINKINQNFINSFSKLKLGAISEESAKIIV